MTQSIDTSVLINSNLSFSSSYPAITITSPNSGQKIFEVSNYGEVYFLINGDYKKVDCDSDVSLMFVSVISSLTGITSLDKDELMSKIIKNYRDSKVNKILK